MREISQCLVLSYPPTCLYHMMLQDVTKLGTPTEAKVLTSYPRLILCIVRLSDSDTGDNRGLRMSE